MSELESHSLSVENSFISIEKIVKDIRKTPLFRQVVPMEAVTGWPIPLRKNGRVFIILPFYGAQNKEKGKTILYPPLALITVDCITMVVVEYISTRFKNSWPDGNWETAAGYFPHEAISKMTIREYKNLKQQLMGLYDILIKCLIDGTELDAEVDAKFSEILGILMEPNLIPFYKAIRPSFFGHFLKD